MPTGKRKHRRVSYVGYHQPSQEYTHYIYSPHTYTYTHTYKRTSLHWIPKQCVLHRSLLGSLWGWFVGKVGELTLRWANNNRISKNTFRGSHCLSVWLITPGLSSADWRLSNLHRVTPWQLETHNTIRTVYKDDKVVVHPSVVFLTRIIHSIVPVKEPKKKFFRKS